MMVIHETAHATKVVVQAGEVQLEGHLVIPDSACGIVVFVHGSGSSRFSPRNQHVANVLNEGGLATLLFDLLTADEHEIDMQTRELRFDINLLSERMMATLDWLAEQAAVPKLAVGLFGASTGAAAALNAAAGRPDAIAAVVSRGGRPDLAMDALSRVVAPTLMIVGSLDRQVIEMNRAAANVMEAPWRIEIIEGATHLFEEPGKLEQVAALARDWFLEYLPGNTTGDH